MKLCLALILFSLFSVSAVADEVLNYAQWEQLNKLLNTPADKPDYLPSKMQPVTDPNGVVQQIINYNIDQIKKTNSTAKLLDTQWGGGHSNNIAAKAETAPPTYVYQVKPFETKAWIEFSNKVKASYNYQVMNHTSEFVVAPKKTILGMTIGYSYQITTADQRNLLSVRYDW